MEVLDSFEDFKTLRELYFANDYAEVTRHNLSQVKSVRDGEVRVAAGLLKLLAEAIIVTNQDLTKKARLEGIDHLVAEMISWARVYRVEQIHAFVKPEFASILTKRYGFTKIEDVPIVLNVEV